MKPIHLLATCASLTIATMAMAEVKSITTKSTLKKVTLYRSQAMAVREVAVPEATGELALVVEGLPPSIEPNSLFASSKTMKIRSVRYLTEVDAIKLPKGEIQKQELVLKTVEVTKRTLKTKRTLLASKKTYLDQLETLYVKKLGPTTTTVDKKTETTGFDVKSIAQMTEFIFKQREQLTERELALDAEQRDLEKTARDAQTALAALRHGNPAGEPQRQLARLPKMRRKAIVYVAKKDAGASTLSLSYLVNSAGWSPAYNMRLTGTGDSLNLEYLAHVRQTTGEDWNGVKLVLSTATPNMNAEIPILAPMWVHLTKSRKNRAINDTAFGYNPLKKNKMEQMGSFSKFQKKSSGNYIQHNYDLNEFAWNRQQLEFSNGKEMIRRWNEGVRKIVQQMAVEYVISDTVTLASRNDNQMVQILSESIACSIFYEAVPLLANYVSRGIEAKNTIDQPLLAGRYSAFIDGQYVGAGHVPVTATGQTLILGLGIDPQLRCRRELTDKLGDKSWGNRTETYKYRLVVDNYKAIPVNVRLMDRIPVTKDKSLKITLLNGLLKLSDDEDYRELDYPKGVLRWDIALPAATSGSKATKFDYSFDMKFDSDMQISGLGKNIKVQLRNDLIDMEKRRKRK